MIITGIGNIYSDGALKFKQVPITVHLMGRQHVLGLIIDTVKLKIILQVLMKCLGR